MGFPGEVLALESCSDWNPWHEERTTVTSPAWCHSKAMSLWPKHECGDAPGLWDQPQWVPQGEFWTRPFTSHFSRATSQCGRAPGRFKTSRLLGAAKSQPKAKGAERRKDLVGLSKCPQCPAQPGTHPQPRPSLCALGRDKISAPSPGLPGIAPPSKAMLGATCPSHTSLKFQQGHKTFLLSSLS